MVKKILFALLVFIMAFSASCFAYANEDEYEIDNEETIITNSISEGDIITSSRYRIVKVHVPARDKSKDNNNQPQDWYNNGTERLSTKKALDINAKYYKVYKENISTGVRNYLYYEYHVTYHWYTRGRTSEPWNNKGTKSGTLRHQITCPEDLLELWP